MNGVVTNKRLKKDYTRSYNTPSIIKGRSAGGAASSEVQMLFEQLHQIKHSKVKCELSDTVREWGVLKSRAC